MDDSVLTTLLYVGFCVLLVVIKGVSSLKNNKIKKVSSAKKERVVAPETPEDFDYFLGEEDLEEEENLSQKSLLLEDIFEEGSSVFKSMSDSIAASLAPEERNVTNPSSQRRHWKRKPVLEEESIDEQPLLADFDARTAIIYSEILKRPEY